VKRTTLEKKLVLTGELVGKGPVLRCLLTTTQSTFQKPDPTALEKTLLLLATLYQHLELDVSPAGSLLALHNQAQVRQTWPQVQAELVHRSGGEDSVTQRLLAGVDQQLQHPAQLLASLRFDYALGFLWPNFYQQRFEREYRYGQTRCFPLFFPDTDCWFSERLEVGEPPTAGQVKLLLRGALDATRTDLPAVARQVDATLAAAGNGANRPPTTPAAVQGTFEAVYQLDATTGWPVCLDASVCCRANEEYSKEYFLRLEQTL